MPVPMDKRGGGGRYGVATVRLTAREVVLEDVDSGDRLTFPVVFDMGKKIKSHRADLMREKKGGLVIFPASDGRAERQTWVYPGFFAYSANARSTVLYGLTPAEGTHLYEFLGFVRKDPKQPPTWELQANTFDTSALPRQTCGAQFETVDEDEFPGLELRWNWWTYSFHADVNDKGQDVMGTYLLNPKAGAANQSQYNLYRIAGIIGRDPKTQQETTLVDIPGAMENYLPAVEAILLERLGAPTRGTLLNITSSTRKNEMGKTKVDFSGLSKAVMAAALNRGGKSKKRSKKRLVSGVDYDTGAEDDT